MPHQVDLGAGIRAGFTTAAEGNLSAAVGDPAPVRAARDALTTWLGAPPGWLRQVHGAEVHVWSGRPAGVPTADAAVTASDEVAPAVLVADCVPVLLADPGRRVVAAVHAGRRGLLAGVVEAALAAMHRLGAEPEHTRAALGPAVCGRCYEVPVEIRDEAERSMPGLGSTTSWGTPALDLPGAVVRVLARHGVAAVASVGCTLEDDRWFSYRGAGGGGRPQGRTAGAVRLVP